MTHYVHDRVTGEARVVWDGDPAADDPAIGSETSVRKSTRKSAKSDEDK